MTPRKPKKPAASNPWPARLKKLRRRLGEAKGRERITQREAAELAGVALRTWINWEAGQRPGAVAVSLLMSKFPDIAK